MRGRWRSTNRTSLTNDQLASRLTELERQLSSMRAPESPGMIATGKAHSDTDYSHIQRDPLNDMGSDEMIISNLSPSPGVPTFSGETSIAHNLTVVEGRLEQMGVQYSRLRSKSPDRQYTSNLTPSPQAPTSYFEGQATSVTQRILRNHGMIPNRNQWEGIMHTFCDEVHVLVPFLHLPSMWRLFEKSWSDSFDQHSISYDNGGIQRFQAAHILLCLANGRCVESSRFEGDEGPYSAGWSFYSAARDVFGDLLDGFCQCADQVFLLQTVVLMVSLFVHPVLGNLNILTGDSGARLFIFSVLMPMGPLKKF